MLSPTRLHRVLYTLITNKYATLKELNDYYTIEDVLDMYEACLYTLHNKVVGIEASRKK